MKNEKLLEVNDLTLGVINSGESQTVLHDIHFHLSKNEILGIVGESGSGKSVTSLAILGLLSKKNTVIQSGSILFKDKDLIQLKESEFRKIRGNAISMIFQEPMSSLNPSMTCGKQVAEILKEHTSLSRAAIKKEVISLFEKVKLPRPEGVYEAYPHQISGGQKQRVMIAMAIACKPNILIADEPTTALDVTVQREILDLLKDIQNETGMSILFISHDLELVGELADRVVVMYRGKIVETGVTGDLFKSPQETYTQALLHARPSTQERLERLPTVSDFMEHQKPAVAVSELERERKHKKIYANPPLIEVKNLFKSYYSSAGLFKSKNEVKAVNDVSFKIYEGETVGLVGESGCGKSTLGNVLLQLDTATAGSVYYKGKDLVKLSPKELKSLRKNIQIIFQDPYSSLNPRLTVGQAITEAMKVHHLHGNNTSRKTEALKLLEQVGLQQEHYYRYPHEFSGGQRQRIGIARTIAVQPKFIVCDESVSALDISVQAQVLNLLNELKDKFGFTYLFISHDLAVVKYMADQLLVMRAGIIEERGEADSVYANPKSPYTKSLIEAIPKGI